MDEKMIAQIATYLQQSLDGQTMENPKFDFKLEWPDLTSDEGKNRFVKLTSAIANTFGPDGFVIYGFDERKKVFKESVFADCKLRDSSDLPSLIAKRVDPLFPIHHYDISILDKKLSIIHVPPSIDKPHVIKSLVVDGKEELNRIFVRRSTGTFIANRHEIELMYYDRKNIEPEYSLLASFKPNQTRPSMQDGEIEVTIQASLENIGRRPMSISTIVARFSLDGIQHETYLMRYGGGIILKKEEIVDTALTFRAKTDRVFKDYFQRNKHNVYLNSIRASIQWQPLIVQLTNGEAFYCDLKSV